MTTMTTMMRRDSNTDEVECDGVDGVTVDGSGFPSRATGGGGASFFGDGGGFDAITCVILMLTIMAELAVSLFFFFLLLSRGGSDRQTVCWKRLLFGPFRVGRRCVGSPPVR